ncbi:MULTISPECIES: monovalent cation/H+ antiporter subunit D family protein [Streptomyces]|uniref:Monovalent cation/H+ antiporter subunit D family protein n=2 Tax=Streptomyces TaxID=1883 RepID=A0A3R7EUU6_9ACTN|nr:MULTISPECIES: monovalent cation/H+ antiporter subunit D family protein [Streptomyces]KNE79095.1 cation:proton antiporter [Streptomyces fradiae]OFA36570.1 cation:proton antiporter [Streptomyces fradiae]PQM22375.1 monovalent cation/H+ antiporter subunit D family protein [Streptomyces xinghaiensis]RKM96658.1 monovalent cation/H+ antiporter subunit D family protein [Streptomyces xinghaiensis]RNC74190.1 monovalent cation/H+ antiporter subunit D family protein [Streptomyces xinghaiensis]
MNGTVLTLPVAVPLLAAGLLMAVRGGRRLRLVTALAVNAGVLVLGCLLLARGMDGAVLHQSVGGWPAGFAIVFAADVLSALMLSVSAALVLAGLAFAAATRDDDNPLFTPLALVLSAGVYGAYLTADLFNFFVFVEVMLVPSYALLTMGGGRHRVAAGRIYVTVSLLASTLLLFGVGLVYGVTGTVNLGELAGAATRSTSAALAGGVVLTALATKAAVVPMHGWLPRVYPQAPPAVTVLFSGLLTKVGLYGIIRVYAVVFDGAGYRWAITAAAVLTMVVGVLGAVGEQTLRDILVFHMVSQIGYVLLGLALFTPAGLTAAVFYLAQYVLVKAALLACAGTVETVYGTGRLDRLGGLAGREPLLAAVFMVAAFSLAGLPPLSGFAAKLSLIRAAAIDTDYLAVGVAVGVSLLTLTSMVKIWSGAFLGKEAPPKPEQSSAPGAAVRSAVRSGVRPVFAVPLVALALPSVVLGLAAQPLLTVAAAAATGLTELPPYVEAVTR